MKVTNIKSSERYVKASEFKYNKMYLLLDNKDVSGLSDYVGAVFIRVYSETSRKVNICTINNARNFWSDIGKFLDNAIFEELPVGSEVTLTQE